MHPPAAEGEGGLRLVDLLLRLLDPGSLRHYPNG
jgi:hypothetical protein